MANPIVQTQLGMPDPNAAPLSITDLFKLMNTLFISQIQGSYIPYVISSTQPSVQDQDKAWIKLDSGGRPLGTFIFYSGNWRRIYNGMVGEIRLYSGNPTDTNTWVTTGGTAGLGVLGGTYDGWAICNGNNGTQNLTDKFILAGHMDNSGGHSGWNGTAWVSWINGTSAQASGGNDTITLDSAHTYQPPYPPSYTPTLQKMDRYSASDTNNPGGDLWGVDSVQHQQIVPQVAGNTSPTPISIEPPFIVQGLIQFIGYS